MIDITNKIKTLRTVEATGRVFCSKETLERIKNNNLPKGNLFDVAKAAGLLAGKNTPHLIPHCHPIPIEQMEIDFHIEADSVFIHVRAKNIARTGLEMEALTAVSISALTIYDLLKPIDKELCISNIQLIKKSGGKTDLKKFSELKNLQFAVLVVSDSVYAQKKEDSSGIYINNYFKQYTKDPIQYRIVPDDQEKIEISIREWITNKISYIVTTGGTGIGPRDVTTDVIRKIIEKELVGVSEQIRAYGQERNPNSMFSRSIVGVKDHSMIIALPGSLNGVKESLNSIFPYLLHTTSILSGETH